MKIRFKITRRQLRVWYQFLKHTYSDKTTPISNMGKLVQVCLGRLYNRLRHLEADDKDMYNVQIPTDECLAFVINSEYWMHMELPEDNMIIINQLIGIIDQKTK